MKRKICVNSHVSRASLATEFGSVVTSPNESDARTHRTPKALVRNSPATLFCFAKLGSAHASSGRLSNSQQLLGRLIFLRCAFAEDFGDIEIHKISVVKNN